MTITMIEEHAEDSDHCNILPSEAVLGVEIEYDRGERNELYQSVQRKENMTCGKTK